MLEVDQTMLVDMSHVNERRDFFGHVVHQVLMLYVPDMSGPSHVAPSAPFPPWPDPVGTASIGRRTGPRGQRPIRSHNPSIKR